MTAPAPDPRPAYPTEADALRRLAELRREGVITGLMHTDRGWVLRYDPWAGVR
jgi:hypothetical protein